MSDILEAMWATRRAGDGQPESPISERRAMIDGVAQIFPLPDDVAVGEVEAGGVPARWFEPAGCRPERVLFYLHGGGYETGSSVSHGELAARLARTFGGRALVPDYRLAPEHPFPAAVEDAMAAYHWLLGVPDVEPDAVVLAGDSAGGGLSASLLVARRDGRHPLPCAAALLSPWADLTVSGDTIATNIDTDPFIPPGVLEGMAERYVGDADPKDPLASPLYADLTGLPPLLILVSTIEALRSDGEGLAAAAEAAGVPVTLQVDEGLPHVWPILARTPEAAASTELVGAFFRSHLGA
jgi:monoterpene epsilon-lactone hydrolase